MHEDLTGAINDLIQQTIQSYHNLPSTSQQPQNGTLG
jgi:hypothetical protein